jgi:hypothetical protein
VKIRAIALMAGLSGRVGDPFAVVHYVNELARAQKVELIMAIVTCSCSWTGELSGWARCPSCGGSEHDRVTPTRLKPLLAIADGTLKRIEPIVRKWLRERKLIVRVGDPTPPPPDGTQHRTRPVPSLALTPAGELVVAAVRRSGQITTDGRAAFEYEARRRCEPDMRDEDDDVGALGAVSA